MPPPGGSFKDTKTSSRGYGGASSSSSTNKGPSGGMMGGTGSGGSSMNTGSASSSKGSGSTSKGSGSSSQGPSGGMQGGSNSGGSSMNTGSASSSKGSGSSSQGPSGGMQGGSNSGGSSMNTGSAKSVGGGGSPTGARGPLGPDGRPTSNFGVNRSWSDYNLRGPTGPAGEPTGAPTSYGNAYQSAQVVRGNYPNIAARVDQTTLARTLDTFARALPGEADFNRLGMAGAPDLARVGINQMVRNISPNQMLAGMDTTGMRPATAGMNLPGPNSMGMVAPNSPLHNLASVSMMDAVLGRGVSPQAMNATNFVAAGTPMVRGVNEVGAPVNGTQFGVDPTGGAAVARRNSVAQNVLDGLRDEQAGISSVANGQGINVAPAGGVQGQTKQFYDRIMPDPSPRALGYGPGVGLQRRGPGSSYVEGGFNTSYTPGDYSAYRAAQAAGPSTYSGYGSPQSEYSRMAEYNGLQRAGAISTPDTQSPPEGGWSMLGGAIEAGKSIYNNAPRVAATIKDQAIANTKTAIARDPLTALGHWLDMPGGWGDGVDRPDPLGGDRAYTIEEREHERPDISAAPVAPSAPVVQAPGIAALWGWQQSPQDWPYGSMPIFGNWRT